MLALLVAACASGGQAAKRAPSSADALERCRAPKASCPGAKLFEVKWAGADLSGVDFSGAGLIGADLSGANLTGANLTGARMEQVNLSGANLTQARMTGTTLQAATLARANLTDADLTDAGLSETSFEQATLVRTNLTTSTLSEADFSGAHLERVELGPDSYFMHAAGLTLESIASGLGVEIGGDLTQALIDRHVRFMDRYSLDQEFKEACSAGSRTGTRPPPPDAAFHPTMIVVVPPEPPDGFDRGEFKAPDEWYPAAAALTEYVACASTVVNQLESCAYTAGPGAGGAVFIRSRQEVTVRVTEASTGTVVGEETFSGTMPEPCPEELGVRVGASRVFESGEWPGDAVIAFVASFVGTPPAGSPSRS